MTDQTPDPDALQRILDERARTLARAPQAEAEAAGAEYVVLALGQERYGVDIQHVLEIQPLAGLTPVPGLPPFWAGVVNLRGRLYPVLNLRRYLALPGPDPAEGGRVVLVSAANLQVALLVDDVPAVRHVPLEQIGASLTDDRAEAQRSLRGVTPDLLAVLNLEALLGDPRLIVQTAVS